MTGPAGEQPPDQTRLNGAELRRHLFAVALSIAATADMVADTLDRLAITRPRDAAQLRARAAEARRWGERERAHAILYETPLPGRSAHHTPRL